MYLPLKDHNCQLNKDGVIGITKIYCFSLHILRIFILINISDKKGIQTHNHIVRKRMLNHLAKLVKLLSFVVSTYLHGAFDCMLLPCHVRVSE